MWKSPKRKQKMSAHCSTLRHIQSTDSLVPSRHWKKKVTIPSFPLLLCSEKKASVYEEHKLSNSVPYYIINISQTEIFQTKIKDRKYSFFVILNQRCLFNFFILLYISQ